MEVTSLNIRSVKAIDIHTHINHNSSFDANVSMVHHRNIEHLEKLYKACNIEMAFCSTYSSILSDKIVVEENAYLHQLCREINYLYQWVVIEPHNEQTFLQARHMLNAEKCVGIKLMPGYHNYRTNDKYGRKIFDLASDFGAIVLIHPEKQETDYIVPLANEYPDVKFIMAHLGDDSYVRAIEGAKHGNVYTDTSGIDSSRNYVVEYAVERIGSERILFGTDTYAPGFQRGRIEYALISDADKENILRNNALRLFKSL